VIWVRIAGAPPRQLYKNADALPYLTAGEAREQLLESVGVLHSSTGEETPNMTIQLRNEDGRCAHLFAYPPIGEQADVYDETGLLFTGMVKKVTLAPACTIEVQA